MHFYPRTIAPYLLSDLKEKIVMIGGPRQCGKTTLSRSLFQTEGHYLNWDDLSDRKLILRNEFYQNQQLIIFDEIHKYRNWRTIAKGLFDKHFPKTKILITGSARLDHFRKGGDSLAGRYHFYRLHPFSLPEISPDLNSGDLNRLLQFGGFPEPFVKANLDHLRRWQNERVSRVTVQDLTDLSTVKDVSLIELLVELLYERVASPLSIKSLQEDLGVSPHTVDRWISLLEGVYFCYRVAPYAVKNRAKAIKKTQKVYLWDWSQALNEGARFENFVASHLLKYCHFGEDTQGYKMELRYIQDTEKREIDFVVLQNKKPLFAVECKTGEKSLQPSLKYYQDRYGIPKVYQVHLGRRDFGSPERGGRVLPFSELCRAESLV
ncbi:MAG: ATP-binding protein [Bdellovibrionales bacterium]|nr:ATP-binding protein [Bdellovibrionales bacterium]